MSQIEASLYLLPYKVKIIVIKSVLIQTIDLQHLHLSFTKSAIIHWSHIKFLVYNLIIMLMKTQTCGSSSTLQVEGFTTYIQH